MKSKYSILLMILFFSIESLFGQGRVFPVVSKNDYEAYATSEHPYEPILTQQQLLEILRRDRELREKIKYYEEEWKDFEEDFKGLFEGRNIGDSRRYMQSLKRDVRIANQKVLKNKREKKKLEKQLAKAQKSLMKKDRKIENLNKKIAELNVEINLQKEELKNWAEYASSLEMKISEYESTLKEKEKIISIQKKEMEKLQLLVSEYGTDVYIELKSFLNLFRNKAKYSLKKETVIKLRKFRRKRNRKLYLEVFYYACYSPIRNRT